MARKDQAQRQEIDTVAVRAGEQSSFWKASLLPPIAQTSTYTFKSVQELLDHKQGAVEHAEYGRYANPTIAVVEDKLSQLEAAEATLLTASGMAAQALTFLTILGRDSHVLVTNDLYPGTTALLDLLFPRYGVSYSLVPTDDLAAVEAAVTDKTRLLFTEFPTNPHLRVPDLEALSKLCRTRGLTFIVDATLSGPTLCRPLQHGADLVIHSATKSLGGHNDLLAGAISGNAGLIEALREQNAVLGAVLGPQEAFLLNRGLKTLPLRVSRQCDTAAELCRRLREHPGIADVFYADAQGRDGSLAARYLPNGGGGLLSFRPKGGPEAAVKVLDGLQLISHAASLGGAETMAQITYLFVTTPGVETDTTIEPDLIRLSAGLESVEDLWSDLEQSLSQLGDQ